MLRVQAETDSIITQTQPLILIFSVITSLTQ